LELWYFFEGARRRGGDVECSTMKGRRHLGLRLYEEMKKNEWCSITMVG
jgi:hypothetical protein